LSQCDLLLNLMANVSLSINYNCARFPFSLMFLCWGSDTIVFFYCDDAMVYGAYPVDEFFYTYYIYI
jgi:hypothetical protein